MNNKYMHKLIGVLLSGLMGLPLMAADIPGTGARFSLENVFSPQMARHGMVVSEQQLASKIGADILKKGGNAVDAAVAVGFALAVVLPEAGNLGGGGFMIIYDAKSKKTIAIDYREMAPLQSTRDMYLKADGTVDHDELDHGWRSVGVPGTVAGLTYALKQYGSLPLATLLAPAIALARDGFIVDATQQESFTLEQERFHHSAETAAIFLHKDGSVYRNGERLVQKDLAWSLQEIAQQGASAFYQGELSKRLIADIQKHGGIMSKQDLTDYKIETREPVRGTYRGYELVSMPPPSSGGIHLIQILNILEGYPLKEWGWHNAQTIHVMTEAMRRAYADRSEYLGDPAFVNIPVSGLTSKDYAAQLRGQIDLQKATPSSQVKPGNPAPYESKQTTHFSVMDKFGNAVANTYTLNWSYGSGLVARGTGIMLNNEMDDFSAKPGEPNSYGLVGGEANAVVARKRPLSSMSPTIVFKDGKPFLVTGSPGGSTIITTVLQTIVNVIDHDLNVQAATNQPRFHHQWLPDELQVEQGMSFDTIAALRARGHNVKVVGPLGTTQSIMWQDGIYYGASDPRRAGGAAIGY